MSNLEIFMYLIMPVFSSKFFGNEPNVGSYLVVLLVRPVASSLARSAMEGKGRGTDRQGRASVAPWGSCLLTISILRRKLRQSR